MDFAIVGIPAVDENVWKVSSEKVPHLTLLYLHDAIKEEDLSSILEYVAHASGELSPFGLSVDYRGTLGSDDADVLFFEDNGWDLKRVKEFRHYLLLNDKIKRAFDTTEQYPEWTPHLTLGYPSTPAKENDAYLGYVQFDRIAVWTSDFAGPEFRLKYESHGPEEVMHFGVKGMQWGVRNEDDGSSTASGTRPVALTAAENKADPDGPNRRDLVKKAALIAGGVALVGGVAYGVHKYGQSSNDTRAPSKKEEPKKELQEPTSLIYLARAKNKGLTFHSKGDTPDFFSVFDKMGLNGEVPNNHFSKDSETGHVAARLLDPLGRKDFASRPIAHDFVIPKAMAQGINTIDDVREKIWPKVSDQYQKFWDENLVDHKLDAKHTDNEGVAMTTTERGAEAVAELFHYGVKGMRWGVRKDVASSRGGAQVGPTAVVVEQKHPGKYATSRGGKHLPMHEDARAALEGRQRAKASTTDALSNEELRKVIQRMQLEQQYTQLSFSDDRRSRGLKFAMGLFGMKRYGGKEKRRFTDTSEEQGAKLRETIDAVLEARKQ